MIGAYKGCAAFIRDMKRAGANPTFWNVSFVGSKALAKELDKDGRGVQISQVVPFPGTCRCGGEGIPEAPRPR
jgi:hypothetical protein